MSLSLYLFLVVAAGASALLLVDLWRLRRERRRLMRNLQRLREDQRLDRIESDWQRYVRKHEERKAARD